MTLPFSRQVFWGDSIKMVDYDRFIKEQVVLLGTRRVFYEYSPDEDIPDSELRMFKIPDPSLSVQAVNPINMMISAETGVGKTRFSKRIIYYLHSHGYNILVFEPKSYEFLNANKLGTSKRLHPLERNTSLPVVSYVPSYVKPWLEQKQFDTKGMNFFRLDLSEFNYLDAWLGLGFTAKSAQKLASLVSKKVYSLKKLKEGVIFDNNISFSQKRAAENNFATLEALGFFDDQYPTLDIKKHWDKGEIIVINFYRQKGTFMNTIVAKVSEAVSLLGAAETRKGLQNVTRKLLVYDDARFYAQPGEEFGVAIDAIADCQVMDRTHGLNTLIIVQRPNQVDAELIDGCKFKFISFSNNYSHYKDIVPPSAFRFLMGRDSESEDSLYCNEERYIYQWMFTFGMNQWQLFFPYDTNVGHGV